MVQPHNFRIITRIRWFHDIATCIITILTSNFNSPATYSLVPRPCTPPVFECLLYDYDCILQAIKNWRCRRPGNEATYQPPLWVHHAFSHVHCTVRSATSTPLRQVLWRAHAAWVGTIGFANYIHFTDGRLYSVDWTRDWTRDWTVGLDSQKVALIILKHQNTYMYMTWMAFGVADHNSISAVPAALSVRACAPTMHWTGSFPDWNGLGTRTMNNYRPTAQAGGKQERKCQPNLTAACIETVQEAVPLGILEFASNDRHVFLEVVVRSWRIRTETKSSWFCMVGPRQAAYMMTAVGTPRVLGKLLAI